MDQIGAEQVSAADYDPSLDRREDENKRLGELKLIHSDKDADEIEVLEDEDEDEDVDDMFAISTTKKKKAKQVKVYSSSIVPRSPIYLTCSELCLTRSHCKRYPRYCCGS